MSRTITSNSLTVLDLTDSRSLHITLASNLPTNQVQNDGNIYNPDWTMTNLRITPQIQVGSSDLPIGATGLTLQWSRQEGTGQATVLTTGETVSNGVLVVNQNKLVASTSKFITYICTVSYDGLEASGRISFSLVSSGTTGTSYYVHIKYGTSNTPSTLLDTPSDYMGIYSGTSQIAPTTYTSYRWYKIKGEEGTSVSIKDTAYYNGTLDNTNIGQHITIYSDSLFATAINSTNNPGLTDGDSYIVDGYLCVYHDSDSSFICAGLIQGPHGDNGVTYYTWIKYATSPTADTLYNSPTAIDGLKYIGIAYNKLTAVSSNSYSDYAWSKFVGDDGTSAKYVIIGGDQIFKSTNGGSSYTPSSITLTATLYGGLNGYQWYKNDVLIPGATNASLTISPSEITNTATYKCVSETNYFDTMTVVKVIDGVRGNDGAPASIAYLTNESIVIPANAQGRTSSFTETCNVIAYTGTTKVTPTIGVITGVPTGVTVTAGTAIFNEIPLTITVANNTNLAASGTIYIPITAPISTSLMINWQKINAAKSVTSIAVRYAVSNSSTIAPSTWVTTMPARASNQYLWVADYITYSDGTNATVGARMVTGDSGNTGISISSVVSYFANNQSTSIAPTDGWSTTPTRVVGQYTWRKDLITYSNSTTTYTTPVCITGDSGDNGRGITSTVITYQTSANGTSVPSGAWNATVPTVSEGQFLWTRTVITYTDDTNSTSYSVSRSGSNGRGISSSTVTYMVSNSGTVTPSGTWNGSVPNATSGQYLWTRTIITYTDSTTTTSYSVSKIGDDAYNVKVTPSAQYFKSTTGKDGTFTPEYIYLYPRFQFVTYSNWQYSVDGGITWVNISGANGLAVGTYNSVANTLRIARNSTLYTDSVTSISFKCISNNASFYDTVSIAKIYDVVDLQIGGRNLALDSARQRGGNYYDVATYKLSEYIVKGEEYTVTMCVTPAEKVTNIDLFLSRGFIVRAKLYTAGTEKQVISKTFIGDYAVGKTPSDDPVNGDVKFFRYPNNGTVTENTIIHWVKIEKGNKATDWTPAPEDVDNAIEIVNTRLTNTTAEIQNTTNALTSRVTATETSIGTINNNVSSITSRITTAEQKITPTSIVSTVRSSPLYSSDLNNKVNNTEIISKINQTAESITIQANKIGLLGATNIPNLTADKIQGGTLTLGGSNAATQNGQLLLKNPSNSNIVKLSKDGVLVKSGHLIISQDFSGETFDSNTTQWVVTQTTKQLDLEDNRLRMGTYTTSGYTNNMTLNDMSLSWNGYAQGVGTWGSFIGHDSDGNFVIKDSVRSNIYFRGAGSSELATLSSSGLSINGALYVDGQRIMPYSLKGNLDHRTWQDAPIDNYGKFVIAGLKSPDTLGLGIYSMSILASPWADSSGGPVHNIALNSNGIYHRTSTSDTTWGRWSKIARKGEATVIWSGNLTGNNILVWPAQYVKDFSYLTCIIGDSPSEWGIPLIAAIDPDVNELHFGAIFTDNTGKAGTMFYGAKFRINANGSLILIGAGTSNSQNGIYLKRIVGWA